MKNLSSLGLKIENGKVLVLDQQLLPDKEVWLDCQTPEQMIECIKHLKVRGAPLIGVAAAVALAKHAEEGATRTDLLAASEAMRNARPTAVNLMWAVDKIRTCINSAKNLKEELVHTAEQIFEEDIALCQAIGDNGAVLVKSGENILTHCNAGGLATAGIGTAVGVIAQAWKQGKRIHVYVDETRPLLQGGRLTAWELKKLKIPHTLICDNMAACLMRAGKIDRIFVGADRIATNGDFANKIGTYSVAVNAHHHKIPFYTAAPYSTVDFSCHSGAEIPIEERCASEVRGAAGHFGSVRWSPEGCNTFNPAFDVTPVELLSGMVLDKGFFSQQELLKGCLKNLKEYS